MLISQVLRFEQLTLRNINGFLKCYERNFLSALKKFGGMLLVKCNISNSFNFPILVQYSVYTLVNRISKQ